MPLSHISGDGFPFCTSSPPMMTEKDSFQPTQIYNTEGLNDYINYTQKSNQLFSPWKLGQRIIMPILPWW